MFAHICFEYIEKQALFKKIICFFKKPDYINKINIDFLNSFYVEVKIKIENNESYKKTLKKINQASKQMKAYNINGILIDKNCEFYNEIKDLGFEIFNPEIFFKKNIVKIIKFLSILENKGKKETICVINDKTLNNLNFEFLSQLISVCHIIGILSNQSEKAIDLIDELYEQKGIPIVLLQNMDLLKRADFIISYDNTQDLLNNFNNKTAYIIATDLFSQAKGFYNNIFITEFLLKPYNDMKFDIPNGITQMEFLGAIDEYYDTNLILNLEISNIITNK